MNKSIGKQSRSDVKRKLSKVNEIK